MDPRRDTRVSRRRRPLIPALALAIFAASMAAGRDAGAQDDCLLVTKVYVQTHDPKPSPGPEPTPTPTPTPGDVEQIRIDAFAFPGEELEFRVELTNQSDSLRTLLAYEFYLPFGFVYLDGGPGEPLQTLFKGGTTLRWATDESVAPGDTFQFPFRVRAGEFSGFHVAEGTAEPADQECGPVPSNRLRIVVVDRRPLDVTKTADVPVTIVGQQNGFRIEVLNPNPKPIEATVTDLLPPGFSYLTGTTTGEIRSDPAVSGDPARLTWPPAVIGAEASIALHFGVRVSTVSGRYTNTAAATSPQVPGDQDSAEVEVLAPLEVTKTADPEEVLSGSEVAFTITVYNPNHRKIAATVVDVLPPGFVYIAGSTSGVTRADPAISGSTLTWGSFSIVERRQITLTLRAATSAGGLYANVGAAFSDEVPGGQAVAHVLVLLPLRLTKQAPRFVGISEKLDFTVTVDNPNPIPVTLEEVEDALPPGFTYAGPTTGLISADPAVSGDPATGQGLRWAGKFVVPAGGRASLVFRARAPTLPGDHTNHVRATAEKGIPVTPGEAGLTVIAPLQMTKHADEPRSVAGETNGYTIEVRNANTRDFLIPFVADVLPPGFAYTGPSDLSYGSGLPGRRLPDPVRPAPDRLSWAGYLLVPADDTLLLHFGIRVGLRPGLYFSKASSDTAVTVDGFDTGFVATLPTGYTAPIRVVAPTNIAAQPALFDADPPLILNAPLLTATLTETKTGAPLPGKRVDFLFPEGYILICQGVTNAHGVASCGGFLESVQVAVAGGYRAEFEGDDDYLPSRGSAPACDHPLSGPFRDVDPCQ